MLQPDRIIVYNARGIHIIIMLILTPSYLCLQSKHHTPSLSPGACDQNSSIGCHSVTRDCISPNEHSSATTSFSHQVSSVSVATPLSPPHTPSDHGSSPPKPKKLRMCTPSGSSLDMPNMESEVHVCACR